MAAARENRGDAGALPNWFDGLIVEIEAEGAGEQSTLSEDGCVFFVVELIQLWEEDADETCSIAWVCGLGVLARCHEGESAEDHDNGSLSGRRKYGAGRRLSRVF